MSGKICFNKLMQRLPVESSDIISVGYDPTERLLEVEFHGGRVYHYRDVEPDIYAQFLRAESHGTFFFAHINGRYRYQRVNASEELPGEQRLAFVGATPDELYDLQLACEPYDIEAESLDLPVDAIQSDDDHEIALKKSKQAYKLANQPVVVSTVSWNILALRGFPGAYAEAVGRWLTVADLQQLLADKLERTVSIRRTLAYYDGKRHKFFTQDYWGEVVAQPKGEGNTLEQLTILNGQEQTIAELRTAGRAVWPISENNSWQELAKWLRLQRRLRLF